MFIKMTIQVSRIALSVSIKHFTVANTIPSTNFKLKLAKLIYRLIVMYIQQLSISNDQA